MFLEAHYSQSIIGRMEDQLSNGETNSLSNSRRPKFRNSVIARFLHSCIKSSTIDKTLIPLLRLIIKSCRIMKIPWMLIESSIVNFFSHMFDRAWIRRMSDIYGKPFFRTNRGNSENQIRFPQILILKVPDLRRNMLTSDKTDSSLNAFLHVYTEKYIYLLNSKWHKFISLNINY